jgi:transposase
VNAILERLGVGRLLAQAVPQSRSARLSHAQVLGVLLRSLVLNQRHPLYSLSEWAAQAEPTLLDLSSTQDASALNDDRVGRALDALFSAPRASLLTELVLAAVRTYQIDLGQFHNDSTTVTLSGAYATAEGQPVRGRSTLRPARGHNKDHRSDLKQLLFVLTISADGAVPVHYSAMDGNTSDSKTHVETWETLRRLAGRADFLYVADSKLCSRESLAHIAGAGGRFITVLPRTRAEDRWFRDLVQKQPLAWMEAVRRANPRRSRGPEDVWKVVEAPLLSKEGYRIVWVWNSLMALQDENSRQARIESAWAKVEQLNTRLLGPRCRLREKNAVEEEAKEILRLTVSERWLDLLVEERSEPVYRQEKRGRPGPKTRYVRGQRTRFSVVLRRIDANIEADARCDGMFPLITNDKELSMAQVLAAYKFQPRLEKRHEQLKTVQDVTPVWLKRAHRIEGLLFVYFMAMLVQALLEREVRRAMAREGIAQLPLYPEERECMAPSTERILDVFEPLQRHRLRERGRHRQTFEPTLTGLQSQILGLLGVKKTAFRSVV